MSSRLRSQPRARALVEIAPLVIFLLAIWTKLSYFNLPSTSRLGVDWYGWQLQQTVLAALGSLATLLIPLAALLLLSPIARFIALWLIDLAATLLLLSDIVHFRYFGDVISVSSLSVAWQVGPIHRSVVELLRPVDTVFFVDLVVGLALLGWYVHSTRAAPRLGRRTLRGIATAMLAAGLLLATVPISVIVVDRKDIFLNDHFRFFGVLRIGLLNYHLYDGGRRLLRDVLARQRVSEPDRARVRAFIERRRTEEAACSELFGVARDKNLIIVMVESLHAFAIGLRIAGQEVTPNLNALASRSMTFENFYGQTWQGNTADGEFTSLQSLHPLSTGAVPSRYPTNYYRGLPRILRERGYATLSAHGSSSELWKMREMHARFGFRQSLFQRHYAADEIIGMGLSDASFFRQTVPWLERLPQPFMAYLVTVTTHHPYPLPREYRTLNIAELEGTLLGSYLQSVHYVDTALGELLERLERNGLLDRSVLALYGDHKAHVADPTFVAPLAKLQGRPSRTAHFDDRLWQFENRLPLIIHLPGDAAAGVRSVSGGHLDIAPTLLNLLGISDHQMVGLGRDLTCGEHAFVVFRDGSFVKGDTLCVTVNASRTTSQCRNMKTAETLESARLRGHFDEARARLEISDLILAGNLIPRPEAKPLQDVLVIAHRGNSAMAPENTLTAIEQAFAVGAQMVEVDVALTRDGVPVLMHDETIDRTTNGVGPVAKMTVEQIKELDAGSWKGGTYTGEPVPTLAEALQAARSKGRLLLDPKDDGMGRAIARVLSSLDLPPDSVVLGTWNDSQVRDFAEHLPDAMILLTGGAPDDSDPDYFQKQLDRGIDGFEIGMPVSEEFVAAAHERRMPVYAYTVNDSLVMHDLMKVGIDGIETDVPAVLANLVKRSKQDR